MRKEKRFHYIYKITRFDGAYYIGMHSTDDLEDGYFGSGKRLWHSVNYHGKEKHSKQILEFLPCRKYLVEREKHIVDDALLEDKRCLNLCKGGGYVHRAPDAPGSSEAKSAALKAHYASATGQITRAKLSAAHIGRKHTDEAKKNVSKAAKERMARMQEDGSWEDVKKKNADAHRNKTQSAETRAKRGASIKKHKEHYGPRVFSGAARVNISRSLIGSARNVKTWNLTSVNGEQVQITNLSKWLKENNLKAGAKVVVRDQQGNITHRFERRS